MTFRCSWSMADPEGCDNDATAWVDGLAVCDSHQAKSVVESINLDSLTGIVAYVSGREVGIRGRQSTVEPSLAAITWGVRFEEVES